MVLDLDELERLAKAATPGPWKLHSYHERPHEICGMFKHSIPDKVVDCGWGSATLRGQDDYAFIAATDPQTILALTAIARAAQTYMTLPAGSKGTFDAFNTLHESLKALKGG